jgi:hypothetical protein
MSRPRAHSGRLPEFVDVKDEPQHVEQFVNQWVRVYEATIHPGTATLFHQHLQDTRYIIVAGGRFRSDEPGRQRSSTSIGQSVPRLTQLRWLIGRILGGGWVTLPVGTVLIQPHFTHPLVHRVTAAATNPAPIRMLGVELRQQPGLAPTQQRFSSFVTGGSSITLEHADERACSYTVRLTRDSTVGPIELVHGAVLAVLAGAAVVAGRADAIPEGASTWLAAGSHVLSCAGEHELTATLVVV